jgi:hypothetical protein
LFKYRILVGNPEVKIMLGILHVDETIILKCIFKEYVTKMKLDSTDSV